MKHTFVVPGKPRTKGRPRMTRRGRAYTPAATHEAERAIAAAYDGPVFTGPVVVEVDYFWTEQHITVRDWNDIVGPDDNPPIWTGDVDNLVKLTLDALQTDQVCLMDDKQVLQVVAAKWR